MCEADAEPFMIDGGQGAELNKSFLKKRICASSKYCPAASQKSGGIYFAFARQCTPYCNKLLKMIHYYCKSSFYKGKERVKI